MSKIIIDCHRHLSITEDNKTYEDAAKALLLDMKQNGVNKSVIIADNVEESGTADIKTLLRIFDGHEEISLIGAINPFDQPEDKLAKIEKLILEKKIIGLKLYNGHDKIYPTDKRCFSTYEMCNKYNIPVMMHTGANSRDLEVAKFNDPKMIVEIANKFPRLRIVISHYFWPRLEYCYEATKDIPNIFFDTSALADKEVIDESGGLKKIKDVLVRTISDRKNSIFFGTDYPMCKTKSHIDLIDSLEVSEDLKENIFSKNFDNLFKKIGMDKELKIFIGQTFNKPGSVLDLGCGEGEDVKGLEKLGWDVEGVDIKTGTDLNNPFKSEKSSFGLVCANYVLHFLKNKEQLVETAYDNLKDKGYFFFQDIDQTNTDSKNYLTQQQILKLIESVGFKVTKNQKYDIFDNKPGHMHHHTVVEVWAKKL